MKEYFVVDFLCDIGIDEEDLQIVETYVGIDTFDPRKELKRAKKEWGDIIDGVRSGYAIKQEDGVYLFKSSYEEGILYVDENNGRVLKEETIKKYNDNRARNGV